MRIEVMACAMFALAACAPTHDQLTSRAGDFAAAGFEAKPANTPERLAMLQSLPADEFIRHGNGPSTRWAYAEPAVCHCLYVGSSAAYERYKLHSHELADSHGMQTQLYTDPTHEIPAYGPWGSRYDFSTTFGF